MEGHRGEPRNKPPFPGGYGLHGRPTLMNNVETFASVPIILERGADWWKAQGVNGGAGLKFFSVSGHVAQPGVFCVPAGTLVSEVIALAGGVRDGGAVGAVQPGGASTNFLGPDCVDLPLTFDAIAEAGSALGTGAMVVLEEGTDLLAAATNVLNFFRNESCGKCVPCREGTNWTVKMLERMDEGEGTPMDIQIMAEVQENIIGNCLCVLGDSMAMPILSMVKHFRPEFEQHMERAREDADRQALSV
jgi:NADH:ubiquinone oxidoreductase subunit F (NADH-binding)